MERNPRNKQRARSPGRWLLLVWHELRLALRRPMLHACVALIAIVAGLSATLGLRDVAAARHDYAARLQQQVEAPLQPEAVMGWSADVRLRAIRSPVTGAALARGIEPSLPLYWDFSPSGVRWGHPPPRSLRRAPSRSITVRGEPTSSRSQPFGSCLSRCADRDSGPASNWGRTSLV
jgi:hypothetical protein